MTESPFLRTVPKPPNRCHFSIILQVSTEKRACILRSHLAGLSAHPGDPLPPTIPTSKQFFSHFFQPIEPFILLPPPSQTLNLELEPAQQTSRELNAGRRNLEPYGTFREACSASASYYRGGRECSLEKSTRPKNARPFGFSNFLGSFCRCVFGGPPLGRNPVDVRQPVVLALWL